MKKILIYLFSFSVFLVSVEIFFNISSEVIQFDQNFKNQKLKSKIDVGQQIKFLVIGESTSASYFAENEDSSWPRLLEKKINENSEKTGFKAVVFNEAVPGTNTAVIALKLPGLIKKYNPQVVISMMGVNDPISAGSIGHQKHTINFEFLKKFKIVKAINYFISYFEKDFYVEKSAIIVGIDEEVKARLFQFVGSRIDKIKSEELFQLFETLKGKLKTPAERTEYHSLVAEMLHALSLGSAFAGLKSHEPERDLLKTCGEYLEKTYAEEEFSDPLIYNELLCFKYDNSKLNLILKRVLESINKGKSISDQTLALLLKTKYAYSKENYSKLMSVFNLKSSEDPVDEKKEDMWATQKNYQTVFKTLENNKIFYISMMYPSGNSENLKRFFSDERIHPIDFVAFMYEKPQNVNTWEGLEQIIFVSNENFLTECAQKIGDCYTDLWTKFQGGKFGHTNTKGHNKIADNVYNEILRNKERIVKGKSE